MESAGIPASCIPAYLGGTHPGRPAGDVVAALGRGAAPKQGEKAPPSETATAP